MIFKITSIGILVKDGDSAVKIGVCRIKKANEKLVNV